MKKLLATLTLSLTAIMATSAMAAPHHAAAYDHRNHHAVKHTPPQHAKAKVQPHYTKTVPPKHAKVMAPAHPVKAAAQAKHIKKDHLRVGTTLPKFFDSKNYQANSKDVSKLAKAKSNQKWYKIHDQYVLVNEKNKQIVSILS